MYDTDDEEEEEIRSWCCYLRPAPRGLSIDTHYTFNHVMDAVNKQRWYPHYCYYCYSCPLQSPNAWENHVIKNHPGKLAYPGTVPAIILKILEIIERN